MEPIKKRRNSILKKKSSEEDTTTEIKARRISFSGKKSVKEFIAGEEAETIWGTSYEESADDLKVSSSESGLVNVHVKRIQLRNRRVICEPQQQKRRSSLKKKVQIAENDKENVCVKPNPPPVEIVQEENPPPPPLVRIEQPQLKFPEKSELAMGKTEQNVSKRRETTMPPKKLVVDCPSICSSTFDFINFSAQINKTITIEQSLDVSLNESELQMFKFRVPVTATDISPNTSNVLCRSILMSEDDVNVLKMIRKQKGGVNTNKEQTMDEELKLIETKKRDAEITGISKTIVEETIKESEKSVEIIAATGASHSMEISHIYDAKGSKRKSERTPHSIVLESALNEMNSPLRKKPMHTIYCSSMDATNNLIGNSSQEETNRRPTIYESVAVHESSSSNNEKPSGRPTIYFNSVAIEESAIGMHSLSGTNTFFDSKTINENSTFPNTTASCLALGNQTDGISMELSICAPNVQENAQAKSETLHLSQDIRMEYTLGGGQQSVHMNIERFEQTQPFSIVKNSKTIYDSSDVEEITVPTTQLIKNSKKQRKSVYTSLHMDEESPKPLKTNNAKGLKPRQTILTPEEIIEDTPREIDPKSVLQKTIITPINIFEDSIQVKSDSKVIQKQRHTINDWVEIKENNNPRQQEIVNSNENKAKTESIYTPTDMIEESPKRNEAKKKDIAKNVPTTSNVLQKTSSIPVSKTKKTRESIYTPSDIIEDAPECILPSESESNRIILSDDLKVRRTIYTPVDIVEDFTKEFTSKNVFQRTIGTSVDMLEDSVKVLSKTTVNNCSFEIEEEPIPNINRIGQVNSFKPKESVYSPSEMLDESSKAAPSYKTQNSQVSKSSKCLKTRQTIFTPEDIIDDSIQEFECEGALQKTTKIPINIFEDSLKSELASKLIVENPEIECQDLSNESVDIEIVSEPIHNGNFSSKKNKSRGSIYTPSDMVEDSPKLTRPITAEVESWDREQSHATSNSVLQRKSIFSEYSQTKSAKSRQTIHDSAHIEEVPIQRAFPTTTNPLTKNRKTIYDTVDIEEVTDFIKPKIMGNKNNISIGALHIPCDMVEEDLRGSESPKQQSPSKNIKTRQTIFTSENIIEDTIKENLLQKTIKVPFDIFEDSIQEELASNQAVKRRQTIYDVADIEEDNVAIQHERSVSQSGKQRKSINIPSEIILDDLEEQNLIQNNPKASIANDSTKSKIKRQTTYNQVDISLGSKTVTHISADLEVKKNQNSRTTIYIPTNIVEDPPKAIKQRAPSKIQVFRRELSSTDLTAKKSLQVNPGEDRTHLTENSNQLKTECVSKAPQFSFAVHQANLKKRQSIHTPADMVEDSPKPIQPSKPDVILRKTVYKSCDITPDLPKSTSAEKIHQQTIKNQADIVIDSPVTTTDRSLETKNRQTVYTPLEITVDLPELSRDTKKISVELERDKKPKTQEIEGGDLPFRKPTKLFSETFKSLADPYTSTKSLMDKVMQDMGYSMNFQLNFPPEPASQELSQSKQINSQEQLNSSINLSVAQDVSNATVSVDNAMELSIANDTNTKKQKQQTMCFSEAIEIEVGNHIQSETSQLYKTSIDDFQMEMSIHGTEINHQTKLDNQQNIEISVNLQKATRTQQLSQFIDETMNNKSTNHTDLIATHDLSKPELEKQKPKPFEKEATSTRHKTDGLMGLSILKSQNSFQKNKQQQESAFARRTSQDIDIANMDIQCNKEHFLPKAPSTRQTIHFNQELDVEDTNENQKISQTMLIHQDLEIEDIDGHEQVISKQQVHNYPRRKTIHCSEDVEVEEYLQQCSVESINQQDRIKLNKENISPEEPRSKTVHLNKDLELEDIYDQPDTSSKGPLQILNRQTMNSNENIEELGEVKNQQLSFQTKKQLSRKTILMNQDLDLCEIDDLQKVQPHITKQDSIKINRRTLQQDLEVNERQENETRIIPKRPNRQTIHLNQDLDLSEIDESQKVPSRITKQDSIKTNPRTLQQDLEYDERQKNDTQVFPKRPNRQTIHLNQDLDLSEIDESQKFPSQILPGSNHLNQDLDLDKRQKFFTQTNPQRPNRQTIHLNEDLDLSEIVDLEKISHETLLRDPVKTNRQTKHLNQDLEINECQDVVNEIIPPNRQTIYFSQDLEGDEDQHFSPQCSKSVSGENKKRQTILVRQELDMSISSEEQAIPPNKAQIVEQTSQEYGRRTVYFEKELEIEDQDNTDWKRQLTPAQKGNKPSLHQGIESEDEYVKQKNLFNETKKNTEENSCRFPLNNLHRKSVNFNNKPEFISQTIPFVNNNSLDVSVQAAEGEKEVAAKIVSKPRRVTICDAQPLDMDESLLPKSTARKSSFSRTLNFDEVPTLGTEKSYKKSISVALQSASKDNISPIYNPSLKPKCPMTPSEVDKSLAEYLKVEAAIEDQEEEIFYDAEDGTENKKQNKRQTCHMPVNIFEESGMQPLQSHALKRQTTFSPKEMTNESLDHGHFTLAAMEAINELPSLHNEKCHNAESKYPMEVTKILESSNNSKQILMKPQLGTNFIETCNIADVSSTWKPSSAVQSVKELLLENTRLFSQSNLMKPSVFEIKRSTVYFAGNNDSMDISCIDSGPTEPESTPTKNKTSRIPQLIGSAKKLESLKKSMEFIQQELPNIGCHLRNKERYEDIDDSPKNQETPRRFSTSIPKKLKELEESFKEIELSEKPILSTPDKGIESPQKVVRQLQESFDTIDIPRKVLSSVRKTAEEFPRKDARELEEPFDANETPGKVINVNPRELQESFDTVEIPRRGTTFQRNDTLYICPNEKETTVNASQKSLYQFEEPPITISDVSTFFSQKLLPNAKQATATYSPNTTEALCKLNVNEIQALSRSPDSEDTTHNLAHFKKRYVELTCDSIMLCDSRDNIEKTHLSLVNTLDDESEMVHSSPEIQVVAESVPPVIEQPVKPTSSSICRKCKCKRLSITQNDTTIGSFMLEPLPVYKVDLSELEQLAKKPNISDVGNVWRQKIRESDSFNVSDGSRSMAMDDEDAESIETLLMELADQRLANAQYRQQNRKEIKIENSFLYKVRRKMQSKSNWIVNDLLLFNNVIVLTHTRIRTFAILINFTPKDPRGVEVVFNDIQFKPNILHTRQWKPFEYALHYQLLVELPFDLKQICPTSEHFFDFLEHVEKVTEDVLRTGKEMLSLVLTSPASLIREPSGRLYIRKYVRTKTPQNDAKRTEIHIEVRNIKKISYESIAMPPLYEFDENIQLLPVGNDFLRKFLNDPLKFIKP